MKKLSTILLVIFSISLCGCYRISALQIGIKNSSTNGEIIKNIKVNWNQSVMLTLPSELKVCGMPIHVYHIENIFGPVHAEWENAIGHKLSKNFIFKKEDFPNYKKSSSYIILYFNQSEIEYYTSDTPNIKKIEKEKVGNWVSKYIEGKGRQCANDPVERKRIEELRKKYPTYSTVTDRPIDED
jgi:hypothetical protein